MRLEREADRSTPQNAEVEKVWWNIFTPLCAFVACKRNNMPRYSTYLSREIKILFKILED